MKEEEIVLGVFVKALNPKNKKRYTIQVKNTWRRRPDNMLMVHSSEHFELGFSCAVSECEPIRITEEWLYKFGFEDNPVYTRNPEYIKEEFNFTLVFDSKKESVFGRGNGQMIPFARYVHELQNIYHKLTEEKLELALWNQ